MEKIRSSSITAALLIQVLSLSLATSKDGSKNLIPKEIKWYDDTTFDEEIYIGDFHGFHDPHMSNAENQVNIETEPRGSHPLNRRKIFHDGCLNHQMVQWFLKTQMSKKIYSKHSKAT